jgi:hypothetical protein
VLGPGIRYDPSRHSRGSAPTTAPVEVTARRALRRRFGADGTPYCACCVAIMPTCVPLNGKTYAVCRELRRRLLGRVPS